ncbi:MULTISPECIES: hypothetical protein [Sphingomonas]|uniref:hypothetical protein n=1 Tax=Sphingomonas TaxID=13687 RepID=UPI00064BBD4D|nr:MULTISPECIES: hypothetical protein [Sphingomonas]MDK8187794.1 hypothetical protein [Sphingomonas zeae]MDK8217648.1 hypothetical protein [Sphingomonas sp. UMB7805-LC452B]
MIRPRTIAIVVLIVAAVALLAWIYHAGSRAGTDHVTAKAERQHGTAVAEARADERQAAATTATIAARTARADDLTDRYVRQTIEDLRNAIDTVPPAAAGDPVPAAPVEQLRDRLNAAIARANRAADPPAAAR